MPHRCPFCSHALVHTARAPSCRCGPYYYHPTHSALAFFLVSGLILLWDGASWSML